MILRSHPSDAPAWVLLSAPSCLLALPADDAARLPELGARLGADEPFRTVLELLVAGGIAAAPSFALVDGDAAVARLVLRGPASAVVSSREGGDDLTIDGAGVATWSERVLEGAAGLRLSVPGSTWTVQFEATGAVPAAPVPVVEAPAPEPQPAAVPAPVAAAVAETTLVPRAESPEPAPEPVAAAEPYDFLFGDTIYRTQAGLSVRIPNPDPERPGDHDGRTMLADELGLAARQPEHPEFPDLPAMPAAAPDEATVVAPIAGYVPSRSATTPAPSAPIPATLQLERADGRREPLSSPVLIGRAPSAPATASGPVPRLITIADDQDISRSHVRVAVEGDAVVVTDLASKNGTVVTLPGGSPRKLRGGEPTVVLPGTLIDLGGGVTFTVRED